ncbi:MAG: hypothetical protein F4Z71_00115 [Gammaproteobacteria bacterium]|nr:hypothetical protein [Gammaproteobacteria bacterium]MYE31039.1 hypothetical protein [Gammaproteobacteria bacterium]
MDFGIGAIFEEFDKRLGRRVSNLLLVCVAILIFVTTGKVILEMGLEAILLLGRLETLSDSEDTREVVIYFAVRFAVFLAMLLGFIAIVNAASKRFLGKLRTALDKHMAMTKEFENREREVVNALQKSVDEHHSRTAEFLDTEHQAVEAWTKRIAELKQWEQELSEREKGLSK